MSFGFDNCNDCHDVTFLNHQQKRKTGSNIIHCHLLQIVGIYLLLFQKQCTVVKEEPRDLVSWRKYKRHVFAEVISF